MPLLVNNLNFVAIDYFWPFSYRHSMGPIIYCILYSNHLRRGSLGGLISVLLSGGVSCTEPRTYSYVRNNLVRSISWRKRPNQSGPFDFIPQSNCSMSVSWSTVINYYVGTYEELKFRAPVTYWLHVSIEFSFLCSAALHTIANISMHIFSISLIFLVSGILCILISLGRFRIHNIPHTMCKWVFWTLFNNFRGRFRGDRDLFGP
jgi:hypothetical protein